MAVKYPMITIRYADWMDPQTVINDTIFALKKEGVKFDELVKFRRECRALTNNLNHTDSLVKNTLQYWVNVEKMTEKRKNWR